MRPQNTLGKSPIEQEQPKNKPMTFDKGGDIEKC